MQNNLPDQTELCRRAFLGHGANVLGGAALASLLSPGGLRGADADPARPGLLRPLHFPPRAKQVIFLYMAGGPSHLETFDYKPKLAELGGKPMPASITKGQPIAQLQNKALKCMAPQYPFKRYGKSGQQLSTAFKHLPELADELCIIRSLKTKAINHDPAHTFMNTGTTISGRPAMGSWLLYGLGSEAENLPGFVVMTSTGGGQSQPIASRQWHSGFLPGEHQGMQFYSSGDPVLYVRNPPGVSTGSQREVIDAVGELNRGRAKTLRDPGIAARISQYELAFKMQMSVPELTRINDENKETLELYGIKGLDGSFAAVVVVGQHAMAGSCGHLRHTYSRRRLEWVRLNGSEIGEAGLIAGIAGELGVPVVCLTGDDAAVDEFIALAQEVGELLTYSEQLKMLKPAMDRFWDLTVQIEQVERTEVEAGSDGVIQACWVSKIECAQFGDEAVSVTGEFRTEFYLVIKCSDPALVAR